MTATADHLEHANRMLDEAAQLDADAPPEPQRTRRRTALPNVPAKPRTSLPRVISGVAPRGPHTDILRALAKAAAEIRRSPEWTSPATWDAIREAIPPDAARDEMARVEAAFPPRFRGVRRE